MCIRDSTHTHIHTRTHARMQARTHARARTCTRTNAHAHTTTRAHVYTPTPPHTHRNKTHLLSYCFWLASYSGHLFPCPLDELWVTKLWCFHDHVQLYINIEMLAQDRMTFCRLRLLRRREDDPLPPEEDDLSPTEEEDLSPPVSSDCYRASRRERGQRARNGFRSSR